MAVGRYSFSSIRSILSILLNFILFFTCEVTLKLTCLLLLAFFQNVVDYGVVRKAPLTHLGSFSSTSCLRQSATYIREYYCRHHAGFSSSSHFISHFKAQKNIAPGQLRKKIKAAPYDGGTAECQIAAKKPYKTKKSAEKFGGF